MTPQKQSYERRNFLRTRGWKYDKEEGAWRNGPLLKQFGEALEWEDECERLARIGPSEAAVSPAIPLHQTPEASRMTHYLISRGWTYVAGEKWQKGSERLKTTDAFALEERIEDEIEVERHSVVPEELEELLTPRRRQYNEREYWIRMGA